MFVQCEDLYYIYLHAYALVLVHIWCIMASEKKSPEKPNAVVMVPLSLGPSRCNPGGYLVQMGGIVSYTGCFIAIIRVWLQCTIHLS